MKKIRINLDVTEEMEKEWDEIQKQGGFATRTEMVKKAVTLLGFIKRENITLRFPEGNGVVVIL